MRFIGLAIVSAAALAIAACGPEAAQEASTEGAGSGAGLEAERDVAEAESPAPGLTIGNSGLRSPSTSLSSCD